MGTFLCGPPLGSLAGRAAQGEGPPLSGSFLGWGALAGVLLVCFPVFLESRGSGGPVVLRCDCA